MGLPKDINIRTLADAQNPSPRRAESLQRMEVTINGPRLRWWKFLWLKSVQEHVSYEYLWTVDVEAAEILWWFSSSAEGASRDFTGGGQGGAPKSDIAV